MELCQYKNIYFIGIGGIGMSALARYFYFNGAKVSGYDKTPTELTKQLASEGISVHYEDDIAQIPLEADLVIYTPAIPKEHKELHYFRENNYILKKRSEVLGAITQSHPTIAIAGTHGKTTVTCMLSHILRTAEKNITAFIGGISKNYNTNLMLSKESDYVVVEADEFDRSFLTLHPQMGIITSMDADHLDIYGNADDMQKTYLQFQHQISETGALVIKHTLPVKTNSATQIISYSLNNAQADVYAEKIMPQHFGYSFNICGKINIANCYLDLPGLHNIENAIAACTIAKQLQISDFAIKQALASFKGVKRRFDYQVKTEKIIYIDDYAHHPEELKACINSVKKLYPGKKVCGIFQPHLFTRTRDFEDGFAESLSLLDELLLMEIYPARELPIPGITSGHLLKKIKMEQKKLIQKNDLIEEIKNHHQRWDVLLTLGAGDIDVFVSTIKNILEANE